MMYKLINRQTGEQYFCDKVTIDGFDYYVSDEIIKDVRPYYGKWQVEEGTILNKFPTYLTDLSSCRLVIATTNPNIDDIPKVVCNIDLTRLCYYDRRNPDFSIKEEYGYDKEEVEATGNFAKKDCACDNCFYGRSALTEQLIKSQETHPFSEEDMVEFALYVANVPHTPYKPVKELFQIWKEQRIKTLYYE